MRPPYRPAPVRSLVLLFMAIGFAGARPAEAMDLVGNVPLPGNILDVAVSGNTLVAASETAGLHVVDATDATQPTLLSTVPFQFGAHGVDFAGSFAFAGVGFHGLAAVNVSSPASPGVPVLLSLPGYCTDVAVVGSVAYVVSSSFGVHVVNVANPTAPVLLQTLNLPFPKRLRVSGSRLHVTTSTPAVVVYDVSVPSAPVLLGSRSIAGSTGVDSVEFGSLLLTLGGFNGSWLDATQPATLPTIATITTQAKAAGGIGSILLTAEGDPGVRLTIVSGVTLPFPGPIGQLALPASPSSMRIANGRAFIAGGLDGLRIVSLSDPSAPTEISSVFVGNALSIDVKGNLAYVGEELDGIRIFDVSNPANPTYVGTADTPGTPREVRVSGTRAYVADGLYGLRIIDVADPAAPVLLGGIHSGNATGVEVVGIHAYVVDAAFRIFDVTTPAFPLQRSAFVPPSGAPTAIALAWPLAFVATTSATYVLNVAQPASPALLATIPAGGTELEAVGRTLYIGSGSATVVVDVSAPALPIVRSVHTGMPASDLERVGSLIFTLLGGNPNHFRVFDASIPVGGQAPVVVGTVPTSEFAANVTLDPTRQLVYAAQQSGGGVAVLDLAPDLAANPCRNGLDDDGDGLADYPADGGCTLPGDLSEMGDCEDGLDNDGDGLLDFPTDPGCRNAQPGSIESPQCNDGADNDGDGLVDHPFDLLCQAPWDDDELANPAAACGLFGIEMLLVLPLAALSRSRRSARPRASRGVRAPAG